MKIKPLATGGIDGVHRIPVIRSPSVKIAASIADGNSNFPEGERSNFHLIANFSIRRDKGSGMDQAINGLL
ncbi:MAG: hypothetical protein P1V20_22550 [Verrucomicrobiales bacterium]|nr:hypothetical protein [Verrucomicrobiales bacterium]